MNDDEMESDEDEAVTDEGISKAEEVEGDDFKNTLLSPEDAKRQGELSEGVKKIKVCLALHVNDISYYHHVFSIIHCAANKISG